MDNYLESLNESQREAVEITSFSLSKKDTSNVLKLFFIELPKALLISLFLSTSMGKIAKKTIHQIILKNQACLKQVLKNHKILKTRTHTMAPRGRPRALIFGFCPGFVRFCS